MRIKSRRYCQEEEEEKVKKCEKGRTHINV